MPDVHSKPNHMYAYTPPTKDTAYGPDTGTMDWDSSAGAKRDASLNRAFNNLGRGGADPYGDIRRENAEREITNTAGSSSLRRVMELTTPTPGRGQTEDPIEGRGG